MSRRLYVLLTASKENAKKLEDEVVVLAHPLMLPVKIVMDTDDIPVSANVYMKAGIKTIILVDQGNRVPDWLAEMKGT